MINFYQFSNKPEDLHGFSKKHLLLDTELVDYLCTHDNKDTDYRKAIAAISKKPHLVRECIERIGKRIPELEYIIADDVLFAIWYAAEIIRGPFKQAEDHISKFSAMSYKYARNVLRQAFKRGEIDSPRFIKGEDAIAADGPELAFKYADYVLMGAFPKGEDAIATDGELAYLYASQIIRKPFPKGAAAINSNAHNARAYAEFLEQYNRTH
jgi:hypothetical protein